MKNNYIVKKNLEQGSEEWLNLRKGHVCASEAPIIMGVCKFRNDGGGRKTPLTLYKEKMEDIQLQSDNKAMQFGRETEPVAREAFTERTGIVCSPAVIVSTKHPFMLSSLDGLSESGEVAVEIKCCGSEDHFTAEMGEVPKHYYPQLQHQLACTGHEFMYYWSYHKGNGVLVKVNRDEKYIKELIKKEKKFFDCMEKGVEPEATEDDFSLGTDEWLTVAKALDVASQEKKEWADREAQLREELINLSDGQNCSRNGFVFSKTERKGSVDYTKIPELSAIDLDQYRKEKSIVWKFKSPKVI